MFCNNDKGGDRWEEVAREIADKFQWPKTNIREVLEIEILFALRTAEKRTARECAEIAEKMIGARRREIAEAIRSRFEVEIKPPDTQKS